MHKFNLMNNNVYFKLNHYVHNVKQSNKHNNILKNSVVFIHFNYIKYKSSQSSEYILSWFVLNNNAQLNFFS